MAELSFKTLSFQEEKGRIRVNLLKLFYFYLDKAELAKIADFKTMDSKILFKNIPQPKAEIKFNFLLGKGLKSLKNCLTNNPAIYLHQNSGIPLIGNVSFGLVYRNTSLIEIKPITSCNLNCIFCSVGEGLQSKKTDFVIEKDYLLEEFKKLVSFIGEEVEAHLGTHGEPFLYADLLSLIEDLNKLEKVHTISVDTNGTLLTRPIIDRLAKIKKARLNISLHTLNQKTAQTIAGCPYSLKKILEVISYAKDKVKILLTPLIVPGYNDSELEDLVKFAKKNNLELGIQNFLYYKTGRNPAKPWSWDKFYGFLSQLEQKYQIKLIISPEDFRIKYTKKLIKPFSAGDVISAVIACPDRFPHSRLAVAGGRTISLPDCDLTAGKKVKIKIIRDKHNIFVGRVIS